MKANIFTMEPISKVKKNFFDLSHDVKMSSRFGRLTPLLVQECLPGDEFKKISSENLIRFAPMLAPVMHKVKAYVHYFFVPNRILWDEWQDFITGGRDGTLAPPIPRVDSENVEISTGELADFFGFPITNVHRDDFNLLGLAAYQKVFYDYYVDPNLDTTEFVPLKTGNNNKWTDYNVLRNRAWQKDYFTSALPWAQRGPVVDLPLGDLAPVYADNNQFPGDLARWDANNELNPTNIENLAVPFKSVNPNASPSNQLWADLSDATAATITDLRRAESLQQFFEKLARGGHRYFEVLQRMFGVKNLDARLDRAEYIGGQAQDVVISEVLQTSETSTTPLADMAGHGLSVARGSGNRYFAPEHGYIIGILSVMPTAAYSQGLPRHYSRSDRFDFYWKEFAHIGEQEILNKEIYYDSSQTVRNTSFGYTPRYAEYRYTPSRIAGDFRTSLSYWHMGRVFANQPNLNTDFVYMNPDSDYFRNIFNVTDEEVDYLWLHSYNTVHVRRPLPLFGVPRL